LLLEDGILAGNRAVDKGRVTRPLGAVDSKAVEKVSSTLREFSMEMAKGQICVQCLMRQMDYPN
jgi:hypothetical protein